MKTSDVSMHAPGHLLHVESVRGDRGLAFMPDFLPPSIPMSSALATAGEQASLALGNLNGLGHLLPNPLLFVQPFVRKEALASTRIEGTRTDFSQLILFEANSHISEPNDLDSQEVVNYTRALLMGWQAPQEWLLSGVAIAELHRMLMQGVRGQEHHPGEFRDVPVLIGGPRDSLASARFVPPPPQHVRDLLDNLRIYAQREPDLLS